METNYGDLERVDMGQIRALEEHGLVEDKDIAAALGTSESAIIQSRFASGNGDEAMESKAAACEFNQSQLELAKHALMSCLGSNHDHIRLAAARAILSQHTITAESRYKQKHQLREDSKRSQVTNIILAVNEAKERSVRHFNQQSAATDATTETPAPLPSV